MDMEHIPPLMELNMKGIGRMDLKVEVEFS